MHGHGAARTLVSYAPRMPTAWAPARSGERRCPGISPMRSARLATLPGRDRGLIRSLPFAVLPVGSVEFHGDHAPFGTDTTLADGFANALAARRPCLVLPPIPYVFVPPLTRDYGPAVGVPAEAFLSYAVAVLDGVLEAGVRRVLVLNGHSENQFALRLAAERACERQRDASVLLVNWWQLVDPAPNGAAATAFSERGGHGHGGPLEISVTGAFDADGVLPAPHIGGRRVRSAVVARPGAGGRRGPGASGLRGVPRPRLGDRCGGRPCGGRSGGRAARNGDRRVVGACSGRR